jgi:hypothetical protein
MKKRLLLFAAISFLIFVQLMHFASSASVNYTYLISNSNDWRDVYSVVHFANLQRVASDFLVGEQDGPVLLKDMSKENVIRVITSRANSFIINYPGYIRDQKFKDAYETTVNNANLELINEMPDVTNFIVVSDQYGYSSIAVAPYAVLTTSWVFFANRANIAELDSLLSGRKIDSLIIYGYVDPEVKAALNKYNPEIIDNSDRFKDNVDIVKKYMKTKPVKQIALTNGEFIEREIMAGLEPVLFTGKENTPAEITEYIKSADIDVGVLIGADLVGAATNIRRDTGISVIVKFARGARNPTGAISAVEGIDTFFIPSPIMNLDIYSIKYNKATSVIEVTYNSSSNIPVYLKGTINLQDDTGKKVKIGDVDPVFIAPNSYKTITYSDVRFDGTKIVGDVYTLYGETRSALEKVLQKTVNLEIVNVIDSCLMTIQSVKYNIPKKALIVYVNNIGNMDCWGQAELRDINIAGVTKTLVSDTATKVAAGKTQGIPISQKMTSTDIEQNKIVDTWVYYGERKDTLLKTVSGKFELGIERLSLTTILLIVFGVLLLIAIFFIIFFLRRRKKDKDWD